MKRAEHIEALERYVALREPEERAARELIASVHGDLDALGCARTYAEHVLRPARLVVAHLEQLRSFIARAERGEVNADDLASAAESVSSLLGAREAA